MRLSNLLIASSCLLAQALALPSNPNGKCCQRKMSDPKPTV
jgi:hypothetical protein